jgi:hypothetical protein
MTDAHDQHQRISLIRHYPDHQPRADDPNYHLFDQAKARIKRQGLWRCALDDADCDGQLELHHSHVEFAYANLIDIPRLDQALGLHLTDDTDFQAWIESPGNLEVLCKQHHTGVLGIHLIPTADWDTVRVHKTGADPIRVDRGGKP